MAKLRKTIRPAGPDKLRDSARSEYLQMVKHTDASAFNKPDTWSKELILQGSNREIQGPKRFNAQVDKAKVSADVKSHFTAWVQKNYKDKEGVEYTTPDYKSVSSAASSTHWNIIHGIGGGPGPEPVPGVGITFSPYGGSASITFAAPAGAIKVLIDPSEPSSLLSVPRDASQDIEEGGVHYYAYFSVEVGIPVFVINSPAQVGDDLYADTGSGTPEPVGLSVVEVSEGVGVEVYDGTSWSEPTYDTPLSLPITIRRKNSSSDKPSYTVSGQYSVSGYVNYLLHNDLITECSCSTLFGYDINLVDASALDLSKVAMASNCMVGMFVGCSSLTKAPSLPATTLADSCYAAMFSGCTSLTSAPSLPATTLAPDCYGRMFQDCESLANPPALPVITLAESCYDSMFENCTSLTSAPSLPATTLAEGCYNYMFGGCTSLTSAPALPAIILADSCYKSMFNGCSSLTSAPSLPATTLAPDCYRIMFLNCSSLTSAPALPATTLAAGCYYEMLGGCSSLTSAPSLPATTLAEDCYAGMFVNCTSLTSAPSLPATTLVDHCYARMFAGCTSLTTSPSLPAITLTEFCYNEMFRSCTSLNDVTIYASDTSALECLRNWLTEVAPSGTVHCKPEFPNVSVPSGWTKDASL